MEKLPGDDSRLRVRYDSKVHRGLDEVREHLPHIYDSVSETAHRDYDKLNRGSLVYDLL